jgi:hypothetical protein
MFSVQEQSEVAKRVAEIIRPLGLKVMALGRVALFYRYGLGGLSKDVDLHPYPMGTVDILALHDVLETAMSTQGGRIEWMADGRGLLLHYPFHERSMPVELILGGEDWIQEEVLEDAVRTGKEIDGILVPSDEHLFVMKVEAYVDRRDGPVASKYLDDMVRIAEALEGKGRGLDTSEVERLIRMRPERKRERMFRACIPILPAMVP